MKKISLLILGFTLILYSCSNISSKSITEKLNIDELAESVKSDNSFAFFYEMLSKKIEKLSDIEKAKYHEVTYSRFFKFYKFANDTVYWKKQEKEWEKEWEKEFGMYLLKADSTINYWKSFLEEKDKNVKIELVEIDKKYSRWGYLDDVFLGFRVTPLQGPIQEISFNCNYKDKDEDRYFYDAIQCSSTSSFSSTTIIYGEAQAPWKYHFKDETVETFSNGHDMKIEITEIRKNGVTVSKDDVPEEVSHYLDWCNKGWSYGDWKKAKIIKNLINNNYKTLENFVDEKRREILERKDKLCAELWHFLNLDLWIWSLEN